MCPFLCATRLLASLLRKRVCGCASQNSGYRSQSGGSDEYDELWSGDGSTLHMDENELRISWQGGCRVQHKNVISLALDQIQFVNMVQRSKTWLLFGALFIGIFVLVYIEVFFESGKANCDLDLRYPCFLNGFEQTVEGIGMAIAVVMLLMYVCTLKTTLLFGCACAGWGVNGTIAVPLLGRDAVENAERIMRKVYDARAEYVRRQ